jgi:hypothetical protein
MNKNKIISCYTKYEFIMLHSFAILGIAFIPVIIGLAISVHNSKEEIKNYESIIKGIHEKHNAEYKSDTLVDISDWNNLKYYELISLNNGKTWYQITSKRNIVGNFDSLHPGLRKKINKQHEDLRKLTAYVDKHGPIGINGNVSEEEQQMLKNVGAITEAKFKNSKKDTMLVGTALPKEY